MEKKTPLKMSGNMSLRQDPVERVKTMCIYHGNCLDGFGAAWVVRRAMGEDDVTFHPGFYDQPPPDVTGLSVVMVDFSYKRDVMLKMAQQAVTIRVLDHHKSAKAELVDLPPNVIVEFDMDKSGAMVTWDTFFEDQEPPLLIRHIQDRDLFRFDMMGSKEVHAALASYPYDFEVWDTLMGRLGVGRLKQEGEPILRNQMKSIREFLEVATVEVIIDGTRVPAVNVPYFWGSEACAILAEGKPFAAYFYHKVGGVMWGLRSDRDGMDVSVIAVKFGGGGHEHASGFLIPTEDLPSFSEGFPMVK